MPNLEVLELQGLAPLTLVLNDGSRRKLRFEQLKSLIITGEAAGMVEFITRVVAPPQGVSLSLSIQLKSITSEELEDISNVLDMVPDLSRCGAKSIQYPNDRRIVRSVYIGLLDTERCEMWSWSSVLPHTTWPIYDFNDGPTETDNVVYRLKLSYPVKPQIDYLSILSYDLDFSRTHTMILNLRPEEWSRNRAALEAIFDDLNDTVETIIAFLWDLDMLAFLLATGNCEFPGSRFWDNDNDISSLRPTIPFPNLRTVSVHNAIHCEIYSRPLTNTLTYRAKHGYRIEHLHVGGNNTQDALYDFRDAARVVAIVTGCPLPL